MSARFSSSGPQSARWRNGLVTFVTLATLATIAACHHTTVVPALKCADPCCEGQVTNIDCAANPDLSCIEDADPCVARVYGCADGSYYTTYPDVTPSTCTNEAAGGSGGLVLGDGGPLVTPEGGATTEGGATAEE